MIKNRTFDISEDAIPTQLFCGTHCKDYYRKFLSDISISKRRKLGFFGCYPIVSLLQVQVE